MFTLEGSALVKATSGDTSLVVLSTQESQAMLAYPQSKLMKAGFPPTLSSTHKLNIVTLISRRNLQSSSIVLGNINQIVLCPNPLPYLQSQ